MSDDKEKKTKKPSDYTTNESADKLISKKPRNIQENITK